TSRQTKGAWPNPAAVKGCCFFIVLLSPHHKQRVTEKLLHMWGMQFVDLVLFLGLESFLVDAQQNLVLPMIVRLASQQAGQCNQLRVCQGIQVGQQGATSRRAFSQLLAKRCRINAEQRGVGNRFDRQCFGSASGFYFFHSYLSFL